MFNVIQSKAQSSVCPHCKGKGLEARMRCDLDPKSCMLTLHCNSCEQDFILFDDMSNHRDMEKSAEVKLDKEGHRAYIADKKAA